MDLSQPQIAIRERTMLEIFDLALHVYRDHAWNILMLLAINIFPFVVINALVVHVAISGDCLPAERLLISLLLIISQAQMGTLLITQYLGAATFTGRQTVRTTIKEFLKVSRYWIWSHGFIRMVLPILVIVGFLQTSWIFLAIILLLIAMLVRAVRPFISEVLLLEQPPLHNDPTDTLTSKITLGKRSGDLHRGDVLAGFILSAVVGSCLLITITSLFFHIDSALGLNGAWDSPIHYVYWPLAAWLVSSFLAVFRFLYYINTRIMQEGWEIAVMMMAEKQKLLARDEY